MRHRTPSPSKRRTRSLQLRGAATRKKAASALPPSNASAMTRRCKDSRACTFRIQTRRARVR
eukprot:413671-Pleurochrysis_carterae.AAC.1